MNEAIYNRVNELWLIFSKQEMLTARFVEHFNIGGNRLPPRRQKVRGRDTMERFTWNKNQNCWMQSSLDSAVPCRVVTVESMVKLVYEHWLANKDSGLLEHEIIRRFAVGRIGTRNDDTKQILKWIKQAEAGGIGAIDTKVLGPASAELSKLASYREGGPAGAAAGPRKNESSAPMAKMTVESSTAKGIFSPKKVNSPKTTGLTKKAADSGVNRSLEKIPISRATPSPKKMASPQSIRSSQKVAKAEVIQRPKENIGTPAMQPPTSPEVIYVATKPIEPSIFLPRRMGITSPVTQRAKDSMSSSSVAVQQKFPPPKLNTTSQSSKSLLATPNPTPSTPTPTKSSPTVKLPFDANFRRRSRSPHVNRSLIDTPRFKYRQRDDDARSPSSAFSGRSPADCYRPSYPDRNFQPRRRDDTVRHSSAPDREAATHSTETSPTSLANPKPHEKQSQPSRAAPARSISVSYPPNQKPPPAPVSAGYPPSQTQLNTQKLFESSPYPFNAPTGPRKTHTSRSRKVHALLVRPTQSKFPGAENIHPDWRPLLYGGGMTKDERHGGRKPNDGKGGQKKTSDEKGVEMKAREVTEENFNLKGQTSSPLPLPKRNYVFTEGRDDLEQYKDSGDYY